VWGLGGREREEWSGTLVTELLCSSTVGDNFTTEQQALKCNSYSKNGFTNCHLVEHYTIY